MRIPRMPGARIFRGNAFASLLRRCGIEPRRYWLLVDLFDTLSQRQELARIGSRDHGTLLSMALFGLMAVAISFVLVAVGAPPSIFCLALTGLTIFQLSLVLLPEVAENLVNPVEGLVLAHQPINGATWVGAKLTHLVSLVVFVVACINLLPAIIGGFLDHRSMFLSVTYPAMHLLAALGAGLLVGLLCCSLFGWLGRFIPVRRLKRAAAVAQILPMLLILVPHFDDELVDVYQAHKDLFATNGWWVTAVEATVPGGFGTVLGIAGCGLALAVITFGLKALSADHLIRVSELVQSGTGRRRLARRRSVLGRLASRVAGGQAGRAGFEYLGRMMLRDWQFKVDLAQILPAMVLVVVLPAVKGERVVSSPFIPGFGFTHFLPHVLGFVIIMVGWALSYGENHKGAWWFLVAPTTSILPFARGIHARLFLVLVIAPNLVLLIACSWLWSVREAALFAAFSAAIASLYLAAGLHLVTGIPFGKLRDPSRRMGNLAGMILFFSVAGIAVGVQYLLFLSEVAVVVAVFVGVGSAYSVTRRAIDSLRSSIHAHIDRIAVRPVGDLLLGADE